MEPITAAEIAALQRLNTPTIANAIEAFDFRGRHEGFMNPSIRCLFPEMGTLVGFAVTAAIRATAPAAQVAADRAAYWRAMEQVPTPRMAVVQDLDDPPGVGSFWGEVNGNIHRALGCVACVTDGGVRDLDEVRALGFGFFAACVCVSHAYVHLESFGEAVTVGGLTVRPGDLLAADQHGVIHVPHELASKIPRAAAEIEAQERKIIRLCQSREFTVEKLIAG